MRKIRNKLWLLIIVSGSLSIPGNSQPHPAIISGNVSGRIIDEKSNTPLEYATISFYTKDSALVTGTITMNNGSFSIDLKPGRFFAIVQFISYESKTIENIEISSPKQKIDLGTIFIRPQIENLSEAVITGEKSEIVIGLDKKVFNVGKDLSNTGKSVSDILDNIPSVTVDLDGSISLRGSTDVQILIDGKPSGMYNAANPESLKSLPGNMVESVEIITNPSAKYEAKGMAGIINIILKKDQKKGVNGTFEAAMGYPFETALSANINFRMEKLNYFLNYGVRYNERLGGGNSTRKFFDTDTVVNLINTDRERTGLSHNFRAGADYLINDKNTLTFSGNLGMENNINTSEISYADFIHTNQPNGNTLRNDTESEKEVEMEFSLNYEKRFAKNDHKLLALAHYSANSEDKNSDITEQIDSIDTPQTIDSIIYQSSENKESERTILFQADYSYPFGKEGKLEAGYRSEFRLISNPFQVEEQLNDSISIELPNTSDTLKYIENIYGLYLQAGNKFGKFSVQTGLRAEISDVRTSLKAAGYQHDTVYVNWFPALHISYQLNDIHSFQVSYTRRINRPHYRMLNPFYSYSDSRNIRRGNPGLRPEYTDSYEGGYLARVPKINFYAGIYYRLTTDVFEWINFVDSNQITYQNPINLLERKTMGAESNITIDVIKWWTLSANLNYYRSITDGEFENETRHSDDYSWNTRLNSRMKLPGEFDLQAIFFYRGEQQTTQGVRKPLYMLDMAISKDFMKGSATLTFNVRDVLNTRRFRYVIDQPGYFSENEFRWSARSYNLTFIYRLNQKKKSDRRNGGNGGNDIGGDGMDF